MAEEETFLFFKDPITRSLLLCLTLSSFLAFAGCGILSTQRDVDLLCSRAFRESGLISLNDPRTRTVPDPKALARGLALSEEAMALDPLYPPPHLLAINLAFLLKDREKLAFHLRYALALFPDDILIRSKYALFLKEEESTQNEAISVLKEGLKREPRAVSLRTDLASALLDADRDEEELKELLVATLAIDGLDDDFYLWLWGFLAKMVSKGDRSAASKLFVSAGADHPYTLKYGLQQAVESGLGDAAKDLVDTAAAEAGETPVLSFSRFWITLMQGRYDEAEGMLRRGSLDGWITCFGDEQAPACFRGWIALGRGQTEVALSLFAGVLDAAPGSSEGVEGYFTAVMKNPTEMNLRELKKRLDLAIKETGDGNLRRAYTLLSKQLQSALASGMIQGTGDPPPVK